MDETKITVKEDEKTVLISNRVWGGELNNPTITFLHDLVTWMMNSETHIEIILEKKESDINGGIIRKEEK